MRKCGNSVTKERFKFWDSLLDKSDEKTNLFKNISVVAKRNGIHTGIGKSGVSLGYVGTADKTWVQCTINIRGRVEETEKIYQELLSVSSDINKKYPELKIVWKPVEKDPINSRLILSYSDKGGIGDKDKWDEIQDDLVYRMIKFEKIFKDWIRDYKV
ncbi:MAG: DUF4268 domain-containing protein [Smithellaceae bacterium]|nr:DUF4268 domain-containing protein [Smithellaceae bacterium]